MKKIIGLIPYNAAEPVVAISQMSITYTQNADTCSEKDECQFLTVKASNLDMGEGNYFLDISTQGCDHWSIDSPDDIKGILQDFVDRLQLNMTREKDIKTFSV